MKNVGKLINGLFIFLAILLLIRVFGCQTHQIGTYEMASTIQPDKRLLVSKIGPGARFPNTLGCNY